MTEICATQEDLRTEAAEWVATLHDRVPTSEAEARAHEANCTQFVEWLRQSPDHVAAFLRVDDTFCRLAGLDLSQRVNVEDLTTRYSRHIADQELAARAASGKHGPRSRRIQLIAWAASVSLITAAALFWQFMPRQTVYTTLVGEQRNVKLPDGSVMTLNTESEAQIDFSKHQRRILLKSGEALFDVEHDERRPFVVETDSARIRAVGTQFDVYQHVEARAPGHLRTTVSVLEGVVQVAKGAGASSGSKFSEIDPGANSESQPARVAAGEQADISGVGIKKIRMADVNDAVAWRERILVFNATPLNQVATEYNRYNTRKIRIDDPEVAAREMSGTYSADHPQLLVAYLQRDSAVSVTPTDSGWTIGKRR